MHREQRRRDERGGPTGLGRARSKRGRDGRPASDGVLARSPDDVDSRPKRLQTLPPRNDASGMSVRQIRNISKFGNRFPED